MFTHILVPLDGSELAECVLPHVILQATVMGAEVTLFHSLERQDPKGSSSAVHPVEWHMRRVQAQGYLDKVSRKVKASIPGVKTALVEGSAAESIIEYAHNNDVDYMVLSTHGNSGLTGWNVSSTVQKVLLRSYISTLLVRAYNQPYEKVDGYGKILLALDCSTRSENTLPIGVMLALEGKSRLFFSHVVRIPELPGQLPPNLEDEKLRNRIVERNRESAGKYLDQLMAQFMSQNLSPEKRLLVGDNVAASLEDIVRAETIELVVISAHGNRSATEWPYGSVAVNLIVYGTVPLLIMQDVHHTRARRTQAEEAAGENPGH